jgi:hypothetical protein
MSYVMKVEMYHGNQFQMQKMQKRIRLRNGQNRLNPEE